MLVVKTINVQFTLPGEVEEEHQFILNHPDINEWTKTKCGFLTTYTKAEVEQIKKGEKNEQLSIFATSDAEGHDIRNDTFYVPEGRVSNQRSRQFADRAF